MAAASIEEVNVFMFKAPAFPFAAYVRLEGKARHRTQWLVIAYLDIPPVISTGFDAMANVTHEIKVFVTRCGNRIVGKLAELMERSFGRDKFGHQAMQLMLNGNTLAKRRGQWLFYYMATLDA